MQVGTLSYKTDVDSSGATRGATEAAAKIQAVMRAIDQMEATAKVTVKISDLERNIAKVKRELLDLEKHRVTLDPDSDAFKEAQKDIQDTKLRLKELGQEKTELQVEHRRVQAARRATAGLRKEVDNLHKAHEEYRKEQVVQRGEIAKTNAEMAKLRVQYVRTGDSLKKLEKATRFKWWRPSRGEMLQMDQMRTQMELMRHKAAAFGEDLNDLDASIEKDRHIVRRWASSLSNVRVHIGFASLTVKQLGIALLALGPYIFGVLGALSTLVGVLAQGIVGAGGLAGAALTGVGLGFLGIFSAVKPAVEQIGEARKEMEAVATAERRYGKNSDQAKAAQEKLNKTLNQMDPSARSATKSLGRLTSRWSDLTDPTRTQFFDAMERGLARAHNLMPAFAKETNNMSKALNEAGDNFFKAFDANEMRSAMQGVMQPLAGVLPTLGTALGNVGEALGNIFTSFGRHFGSVGNGLLNWSQSFLQITKNTEGLNDTVDDLMDSAESLVHFFAAAGRSLWTFFTTGADAGRGWVDDMTDGLNDWNRSMKTVQGQQGLRSFFDDSIEKTKILGDLLGGLSESLFGFAELFAGPAESVGRLLNSIIDLVTWLQKIPGLGQAINVALGVGLTAAIGRRAAGLFGLNLALGQTARTAKTAFIPAMVGTGKKVGLANRQIVDSQGKIRSAGGQYAKATLRTRLFGATLAGAGASGAAATGKFLKAASAVGRLAAGAARFAGPIGIAASTAYFAADAFGLFGDGAEEADISFDDWIAGVEASRGVMPQMTGTLLDAAMTLDRYAESLRAGGREAMVARQQYKASIEPLRATAQEQKNLAAEMYDTRIKNDELNLLMSQSVPITRDMGEAYSDLRSSIESELPLDRVLETAGFQMEKFEASLKRTGTVTDRWRGQLLALGASEQSINGLATALNPVERTLNRGKDAASAYRLAMVNLERTSLGLEQLGPKTQKAFSALEQIIGRKKTAKIAIQVDKNRAQRDLLNLVRQADKLGKGKQAIKIALSDGGAKSKIKELQNLLDSMEKPRKTKVDASSANIAQDQLKQLKGAAEAVDGKSAKVKGEAETSQAEQQIEQVDSALGSLDGQNATVSANASTGGALGGIFAVRAQLAALNGQTATVYVRTERKGGNATGGPLAGPGVGPVSSGSRPQDFYARGGKINRPTFVVGEEAPTHPEYVIATNPAYRKQNVSYLRAAAASMGMAVVDGFYKKGGKLPPKKKFKVGAIDENKFRPQYERSKGKVRSAEQRLKEAEKEENRAKGGKEKGKARDKVEKARARLQAAREEFKPVNRRWKALRKINKKINKTQSLIDLAQARMDEAEANNRPNKFQRNKDKKTAAITDLLKLLKPAWRKARGVFKNELGIRIADLKRERGDTDADQFDYTNAPEDQPLLSTQQQTTLDQLEANKALAALTVGPGDDKAAGSALVGFWQDILNRAQDSGAPAAHIREAAEALLAAKNDLTGGASGGVQSQGDIFLGARQELFKSFAGNTRGFSGRVSPFASREGTEADTRQGRPLQITNNFAAPPPDPHTWTNQQAYEAGTL
jgi:chromosome segregation ATPase